MIALSLDVSFGLPLRLLVSLERSVELRIQEMQEEDELGLLLS